MLTRDTPRLWSINAGRLMVVTDLHGDWDGYRRARDRFVNLHARGELDYLIFTGDLIHREAEDTKAQVGDDRSLDILLDVMDLQRHYGETVTMLLGNHEMPHIYATGLARGNVAYTPPFEAALSNSGQRDQVRQFLASLPFYLRTAGGVSLAHAGASQAMAHPQASLALFTWTHEQLLSQAESILQEKDREQLRISYAQSNNSHSYQELVKSMMGVDGPADPHYDDLLRGFLVTLSPAYRLLWAALFTRCEKEYGMRYPGILTASLGRLSENYHPQRVLVSGHMVVRGGSEVVSKQQLRLASCAHASPREAGCVLMFDAEQPVENAELLLKNVQPLFSSKHI